MVRIQRDPEQASSKPYDLIVVGGGIYGAMLALEASARRLRPLLLERHDFGGATSFNSLRIVHGGLRYLQSLDLLRFRESVVDRRWWLTTFPDLVRPLPVLMPLYSRGLRRRGVLRSALALNDLLSAARNKGVPGENQLPRGRIADVAETRALCPAVDAEDLAGGAIWFDAAMPDSQRLLMEVLRWSTSRGAVALNYMEAQSLLVREGKVRGVRALDRERSTTYDFQAPVVFNATGPWCEATAREFGSGPKSLFRPSLAWNLLLRKKAISNYAVALTPPRGGPTYFAHPWKGKLLLGTGHAPFSGDKVRPEAEQIGKMLADVSAALPALALGKDDVLRVFSGLLPIEEGARVRLISRPVLFSHDRVGGPRGLISVVGVKFTTSRNVACRALALAFGPSPIPKRVRRNEYQGRPDPQTGWDCSDFPDADDGRHADRLASLRRIVEDEAVVHLTDLVFRRTTLWEQPSAALSVSESLCESFRWPAQKRREELQRVRQELAEATENRVSTAEPSAADRRAQQALAQ